MGPFSDIYEKAKNHVQITQLFVRGDDGALLNSRHERKMVPIYMRSTEKNLDTVPTIKFVDNTPKQPEGFVGKAKDLLGRMYTHILKKCGIKEEEPEKLTQEMSEKALESIKMPAINIVPPSLP